MNQFHIFQNPYSFAWTNNIPIMPKELTRYSLDRRRDLLESRTMC